MKPISIQATAYNKGGKEEDTSQHFQDLGERISLADRYSYLFIDVRLIVPAVASTYSQIHGISELTIYCIAFTRLLLLSVTNM